MAEQSRQADGGNQAASGDVRQVSFEDALAELKQIVERLEKGEGKLDEAIQVYERDAPLKRHCEHKLKEAETKIEKIRVSGFGEAPARAPTTVPATAAAGTSPPSHSTSNSGPMR